MKNNESTQTIKNILGLNLTFCNFWHEITLNLNPRSSFTSESLWSFLSLVFSALVTLYLTGDILYTCRGNTKMFFLIDQILLVIYLSPKSLMTPGNEEDLTCSLRFPQCHLVWHRKRPPLYNEAFVQCASCWGEETAPSRHSPNHMYIYSSWLFRILS